MEKRAERGFVEPPKIFGKMKEDPIKLCHEITRLSHARVRDQANMDGVMSQPGARSVLAVLAHEQNVTQRIIVDATHLKAPTVSVILRKMEAEGMVERQTNPHDRREVRVHLTEKGRQTDAECIEKIRQTDAIAMRGLCESETEVLMSLLRRMRDNLIQGRDGEKDEKDI